LICEDDTKLTARYARENTHIIERLSAKKFNLKNLSRAKFNMKNDKWYSFSTFVFRSISLLRQWPTNLLEDNPNRCLFRYFKRGALLVKDDFNTEWIYVIKSVRDTITLCGLASQSADQLYCEWFYSTTNYKSLQFKGC